MQPVTSPLTVGDIAERLGGRAEDLQTEVDSDVNEALYEGVFSLGEDGESFVVHEDNGFQGTRPEVLRRLSDGARVVSLYWNVNHHAMLSYAVYGTVITTLDPMLPDERGGKDPRALDTELAVLDATNGFEEWQAAAMAVVEVITGVRLTLPDADAPRLLLEDALPSDPVLPTGG